MQALVKHGPGPGRVELRDVPAPALRAGTVVVAPEVVGVCGSDLHMWRDTQSWAVADGVVLGHEVAGTIVEVADDVTGWDVGDRVVVETAASICGACALCRSGRYNLCPHREGYGAVRDGCFAARVVAQPRVLHRLPAGVDPAHAALTEPYCVAYTAIVERAPLQPGQVVVVQGVGPIGALCVQLARLQGAGTIVALGTGVDTARLETAHRLGADHTVDVSREDPAELLRGLGDGHGADLVVDATGASRALEQSLQLVRPAGSIAKVGWGPQPLGFSLDPLVAKAVTLYGSFSHTWTTWERVLALMAGGRIDPGSVIGGTYPLASWQAAFEHMESGHNVKSVMTTDV